jgi:HAMP domain-containing protein
MAIVLVPLVLGPLVTVALLLYRQAQSDITRQVREHLASLAIVKEAQLDLWVAGRRSDIDNLARSPDVLTAAQAFVLGDAAQMQTGGAALAARFDDYLLNPNNANFTALLLARADTGQIVLASTSGQALLGQRLHDEPFFDSAHSEVVLVSPRHNPLFSQTWATSIAAAPVVAPDTGTVGILVGVIQNRPLVDIMYSSVGLGLGRTGRAYVITGDGYELGRAITAQAVRPDSLGIREALQNHREGSAQYLDPGGQRVVGHYKWIEELELALLVEQNAAEAYAPLASGGIIFGVIISVAVLVGAAGVFLVTRRLTRPVQELTDSAIRIAGGDLSARVHISRQDEIGLLAQAFNSMAIELSDLYQELESKVEARTRQLAAAAEVGRAAASILNTDALLSRTADLIRERFGYHYVAFFLVDDSGREAILRHATSGPGPSARARGVRIMVNGESLIGWVVENKKPRIVSHADDQPAFRSEWPPDTRSEAALPLRAGERVIGVLDVHSPEASAFGPADVETMLLLADQIAVAVENGRLFGRQHRLMQLEQVIVDFTAKIHRATTFDAILENAATELGRAFGARKAVVRFRPAPEATRPSNGEPSGEAPDDGNGQNSTPPARDP